MQKLSQKQFVKRQTEMLLLALLKDLVSKEEAEGLTLGDMKNQFPKVSSYKDQDTGCIRVGLSYRGVKKLVKKNPHVTLETIKKEFKLA